MDYHRYNSLGIGSIPLLPGSATLGSGNALTEHAVGTPGVGGPMPGTPTSLLPPHPSLMFHYGMGGKPSNLPSHLLPTVSAQATSNSNLSIATNCNTLTTGTKTSCRTSSAAAPSAGTSLPPNTRATSPNSSFAAALRSLAKQATGPLGEGENSSHNERVHEASPKPIPSSSCPTVSISSAPIVSIGPHYSFADMRKDGVLPADIERLGPEDMVRGFQPYRAPEMTPIVSAASQLRQSLPLELSHPYQPYPSIYPHHISHQYRLEEQMYLERYGLLRPSLPTYGLPALYSASPYLSARFPPELLQTSLHPSSALLHERLKLEEDIRQREYELELRREREIEREKGKEKERERRQKDENDRKDERGKSSENLRDRSPLSHSSSWSSSSGNLSSMYSKKGINSQSAIRVSDPRSSKASMDGMTSSSKMDSPLKPEKQSSKTRCAAIVRPFESTVQSTTTIAQHAIVNCKPEEITLDDKKPEEPVKTFSVWQPMKLAESSSSKSPAILSSPHTVSLSPHTILPSPHTILPSPHTILPSPHTVPQSPHTIPLLNSLESRLSQTTQQSVISVVPSMPISSLISLAGDSDSKRPAPVPVSTLHQPFLSSAVASTSSSSSPSGPCKKIKPTLAPPTSTFFPKRIKQEEVVPVSRLDIQEKRLKELKASGMLASEVEETLLEEAQSASKYLALICSIGPSAPFDKSKEKADFLSIFGLTSHDKANEVLMDRCLRHAKAMAPLAQFLEETPLSEESQSSLKLSLKLAPGVNLQETPKMKSTSSLLVDFSGKSKFLHNFNMQPQHSAAKHKEIERVWKIVMEERLRRYDCCKGTFDQRISGTLKQLLKPPSSMTSVATPDPSVPLPSLPITSKANVIFTSSNITPISSTNKIQPSMKGIIEDRIFGIGKFLTTETDPLMTSLSGFDKMIDHFVKNAQAEAGNENAVLLSHIEAVRGCQTSVCETAREVQEQVTKLIASRAQLEAHRAALHHHLTSITTLLASKNHHQPSAPPTSCFGAPSSSAVSTSAPRSIPATTVVSWAGLPFLTTPTTHKEPPLRPKGSSGSAVRFNGTSVSKQKAVTPKQIRKSPVGFAPYTKPWLPN